MRLKARSLQVIIYSLLLITSLEAAETKELEEKIAAFEKENYFLRQELNMEKEAANLLGQKLLKEYENKAVLEDKLKYKDKKIETLEEELAGARKLMENEAASHRKQIQRYESLKGKDSARNKNKITEAAAEIKSEKIEQVVSGEILSVSKEFNFVIIEFKDSDIVEAAGKVFSIFREERKIGKVEITKIRGKYVFAKVLDTIPREEIKEGDIIR